MICTIFVCLFLCLTFLCYSVSFSNFAMFQSFLHATKTTKIEHGSLSSCSVQIRSSCACKPLQYIETSGSVAWQVRSSAASSLRAASSQAKQKEPAVRCRAFAGTKEQLRGTTVSFLQKEPVRAQPCSAETERAAAALGHHCAYHLGGSSAATL